MHDWAAPNKGDEAGCDLHGLLVLVWAATGLGGTSMMLFPAVLITMDGVANPLTEHNGVTHSASPCPCLSRQPCPAPCFLMQG